MPKVKVSVADAVKDFYQKKKAFDDMSKTFDKAKAEFYKTMEKAGVETFELEMPSDDEMQPLKISVKRIQNKSVEFNGEKLAERLKRLNAASGAVSKKYSIIDYEGLVTYLKKCGVDPKVFKKFVAVQYVVDKDNIKQMYELGQLSLESLEGCYEVKLQKPYYKLTD